MDLRLKDQLYDKPQIENKYILALLEILCRIDRSEITWALTGSLAFSLQGIPYCPNDIDIRTDKVGAYAFGKIFSSYLTDPVAKRFDSERVSSHLGKFNILSVEVEVMGDMQFKSSAGSWDVPENIQPWIRWISFDGHKIPVLSLDFEAKTYQLLGRHKKALVLTEWDVKKPSG